MNKGSADDDFNGTPVLMETVSDWTVLLAGVVGESVY